MTLSKVRLLVGQSPEGQTTHQLYFGSSPAPTTLIATLSGNTKDMQWLEVNLPDPKPTGRYLRVQTTASPSWVAWREIVVEPAEVSTSASSSTAGAPPANAVDLDPDTAWNSGTYPPAWIELDLKRTVTLSKVGLLVGQNPAGPTTHQLYFGSSPAPTALIATLSGNTQDMQWLEVDVPDPKPTGRYLRVLTTESPSWVAWREIVVLPQ